MKNILLALKKHQLPILLLIIGILFNVIITDAFVIIELTDKISFQNEEIERLRGLLNESNK